MAVVREDVVKFGFEFDSKNMNKANDSVDDLVDKTQELGGPKGTGKAEDGFESAAKAAKKFGDTKLDKLSDGIDKIVSGVGKFALSVGKTAAKGIAVGAAAGATALVALGTQAVKGYAEYEQLVGGVETLFGAGGQSIDEYAKTVGKTVSEVRGEYDGLMKSQTTVLNNANNAYKTAGMSANDYMSNVTSFSASLISSVGGDTQKAAKIADQAMVDISDNANKMGTDMESVIGTYQSLARGNFGMLDNLKLGYGGTKAEMERLLKDAEKLTGKKFDISNFADITEAIHAVQVEMGIAGTTAKEASETIQGSALAMKAAWSNFLVGMANEDADFDQLLDNLVDSVNTFLKNVIPRIKKMLPRMIKGLAEIAKTIGKELPGILDDLLPALAEGAFNLLGSMYNVLRDNASMFKSVGLSIIKAIYKGITGKDMPTETFDKVKKKLDQVFEAVKNIASALLDFGKQLWTVIGPALGWIADVAIDAFSWIGKNIDWIIPVLGSLLGAMLAFKAVRKVSGIVSGFMGLFSKGGVGGAAAGGSAGGGLLGGGGLFGMNPKLLLKGLANIGIVVVALGSLAALVMWAAPKLSALTDTGSLVKLGITIVAVGLVGSAMAALAGVVGKIPVMAVLKGMLGIAIALGGITAIIAAFGALSKIEGFDEFINSGGQILADICGVIGEMAGSVIGGFGEGVTASLPTIGQNLSDFAASIEPMLTTFSNVDATGLGDFAKSLGIFIAALAAEDLVSAITGGVDYAQLGTDLNTFASNLGGFFTTVSGIDDAAFTKASSLFDCLANVTSLPKEGGVVGWFQGEVDFAKLATGMQQLASAGMVVALKAIAGMPEEGFTALGKLFDALAGIKSLPKEGGVVGWFQGEVDFTKIVTGIQQLSSAGMVVALKAIQNIPEEGFTALGKMFDCLAGIKSLPKEGGVVGWFQGEVDFAKMVVGVQQLGSAGMVIALKAIAGIPEEGFTALGSLFDTLAGIKAMPKSGGIAQWFAGDSTTGLTQVAAALPGVATDIASFFTNLGGITDFTPIKSLFDTLGSISIDADAAEKGFLGLGSSDLETLGTGLSNFATNASTFFDTVKTITPESLTGFFTALGEGGGLPEKLAGLDGTIGTTMSTMATNISTNMETIKTTLDTGFNAAIAAIALKQTGFFNAGMAIMQGLNAGILSMEGTVMATVNRIASKIQSTFNSAMRIASPSKVMETSGEWSGLGVVKGLLNTVPQVQAATTEVSSAMIPYGASYTPESSANSYYWGGETSEVTTISPVFNLTISGTTDDRSMARRVKRYVADAINETFESLERKSYAVREV